MPINWPGSDAWHIKRLSHKEPKVQIEAIEAILKRVNENTDKLPIFKWPLLCCLNAQAKVRNAAIDALEQLIARDQLIDDYISALSWDKDARDAAAKELELLNDKRAIEPLLELFNSHGDSEPVETALINLGAKKQLSSAYIARLVHPNPSVRFKAAQKLREIGDCNALEPLSDRFDDYWESESSYCIEIGKAAIDAAVKIGGEHAIEFLLTSLAKGERIYSEHVKNVLDRLNISTYLIDLTEKLSQEVSSPEKIQAIEELGEKGNRFFLRPLMTALITSEDEIRTTILSSLEKLDSTKDQIIDFCVSVLNKEKELKEWKKIPQYGAFRELENIKNERVVEELFKLLASKTEFDKRRVIWSLGNIGDARSVDPLIAILKEENFEYEVIIDIVEALGKLGDKRAIDPILKTLESKNLNLRFVSAVALRKLGSNKAVDIFLDIIANIDTGVLVTVDHNDKYAREAAREELDKLEVNKSKLIEAYLTALSNNRIKTEETIKELIRLEAIETLMDLLTKGYKYLSLIEAIGNMGDNRAIETLISILLDDSDKVRIAAQKALTQLKVPREKIYDIYLTNLSNNKVSLKQNAAKGLGELGDKRAIEPLRNLLLNIEMNKLITRDNTWDAVYCERIMSAVTESLKKLGVTA
jgi:HEAT repeat protein